jgi:hypothetical protein
MSAVDAGVVFLPRFTTLVGATNFFTAPLDASRLGGVQFQVWRGPIRSTGGQPSLQLLLEESLDADTWAMGGGSSPAAIPILEGSAHFFSYSFRLRWFRLRLTLTGTNPMVTCWAEGLLRGGGEGMWGGARGGGSLVHGEVVGAEPGRAAPGPMGSVGPMGAEFISGGFVADHERRMQDDPLYRRFAEVYGPNVMYMPWPGNRQTPEFLPGQGVAPGPRPAIDVRGP